MSSHELSLFTGDHVLESSESETESQTSPHVQGKTKQAENKFRSWTFQDTIQADVLDVSLDARKALLAEHIRTRTSHHRPSCVLSFTIFADLKELISARPHGIPTVSIAVVGYVQTKSCRTTAMTA
jgi:hypothetical protein